MSFWTEFRDRRMFRIVAGYAAAGWVVLQVTDQLTNQAVVPDVAYTLMLIWYVAGFPAAMILGWYHGEKGQQRATKLELALLVVILVGGLSASSATLSDEMGRRLRVRAAAEGALDVRSVAVLYFTDNTATGQAQHIAEGFTEALMDRLATVRELRVVSRSGVDPFRNPRLRRDSIARVLQAGTLVEGSVDQIGDRIRVSLHLIDGQSGAEFRRAAWDRPADELLRVRDDIVGSAADMLREWLGEEVRLRHSRTSTADVRAWALYQRAVRSGRDADEAVHHADEAGIRMAFARADSLLARAELLDPEWPDPSLQRARLAFRQARLAHDPTLSLQFARSGLEHVDRTLTMDPHSGKAMEIRGTLLYWEYLLEAEHDPAAQHDLLERAREDLERALSLDPRLASAHATLSHLHLNRGDEAAAVLAGRRALEEDAWLENADVITFRLASSHYNLERFGEAKRWCDAGRARFPDNYRFAACELLVMTTPEVEPDVDRAWATLARLDSLAPPADAEWQHIRGTLLVAGVIARAALPDSARSVMLRARSRVSHAVDPVQWLYFQEAYVRTLVGDLDESIDLLKRYSAVNPGISFEHHWWWRELRQHPRYREIAG